MTLYEVMIGTVTPEEFMQAYDIAVECEHKRRRIDYCRYRSSYILDRLVVARRELTYLQDIEFWDPHLLTKVKVRRMGELREHIAQLEKERAEIHAELKQLLG